MKYFVIVNRKYILMVEATSACSAEHIILDDIYYGIKSSQAFALDEINTDCFRGMASACESISIEELRGKTADIRDASDAIRENGKKFDALTKLVDDINKAQSTAEELGLEANIFDEALHACTNKGNELLAEYKALYEKTLEEI